MRLDRQRSEHRIGPIARLLAAAALVAVLAACTAGPTAFTPPTSSSEWTSAQLIATAQRQAAMYDYEAALATLEQAPQDDVAEAIAQVESAQAAAVEWADNATISHLFWHSLIVDPDRAFNDPNEGVGFSQYMVTVDEFTAQLQQLYDNGYVLIHPDRIAVPDADGVMQPQPIMLPPGKTPLVISVDDVSYYEYMEGTGFADKLVIDADGDVVNEYTDADGETSTGSYDIVPIVDDFIDDHPDFSYRGDKGVLALTGYNGALGYRSSVSSYGDTEQTQQEIAAATQVADALKQDGWQFASHTWGHLSLTATDLSTLTEDAARWDDEVRPIVGDTPYLIYPFGADIAGIEPYGPENAKFDYLYGTEKFSYYFNVDASRTYWMQIGEQSVRQARINVDGISLQRTLDGTTTVLDPFFDAASTVDEARPLPVPLP